MRWFHLEFLSCPLLAQSHVLESLLAHSVVSPVPHSLNPSSPARLLSTSEDLRSFLSFTKKTALDSQPSRQPTLTVATAAQ